jgi:hypothetical protein
MHGHGVGNREQRPELYRAIPARAALRTVMVRLQPVTGNPFAVWMVRCTVFGEREFRRIEGDIPGWRRKLFDPVPVQDAARMEEEYQKRFLFPPTSSSHE